MAVASLLLAFSLACPQEAPAGTPIPALDLTVDFSLFEDLKGEAKDHEFQLGWWTGTLDGAELTISLRAYNRKKFKRLRGPGDVEKAYTFNRTNRERENGAVFEFEVSRGLPGAFGELSYGWFSVNERYEGTKLDGHEVVVAGLVPSHGYYFEFTSKKPLTEDTIERIASWASESIRYAGETLDPNWSEGDAEARWERDAPPDVLKAGKRQILRSKYYIIFTDLGPSTARSFIKKADANYEHVRSVFPFEDVEGQRLLPIFYFNGKEAYYDWWVHTLKGKRESAERSAGVASGDVYSTYHQSVNAPVHIHEQTHQIFRNRLRLAGGGSWFQEGVAEYMSVGPGELGEIKRLSQKDDALTPFTEFMVVPSLLMSSKKGSRLDGGSNSGLAYTYAASVIEFAKHSKFGRDKFLEWVHGIGKVGRGDLPAIEGVTSRVYGVSLTDFETEFRSYWGKRRKVKDWHAPADKGKKKRKR